MSAQPLAFPGFCDYTCSSSRSDLMSSDVLARLPQVRQIWVSSTLVSLICNVPQRLPCTSCPPLKKKKKRADDVEVGRSRRELPERQGGGDIVHVEQGRTVARLEGNGSADGTRFRQWK